VEKEKGKGKWAKVMGAKVKVKERANSLFDSFISKNKIWWNPSG
jgi:hypothetical protein